MTETLSDKLLAFYKANNLPLDGGVSDKWGRYSIGRLSFVVFPNFKHRVESIIRHDLNHIVNELGTSPLEEGMIAAFEVGSGCRKYWFSWFMECQALWFGIVLGPRLTWEYFLRGRASKNFYQYSSGPMLEKELAKPFRGVQNNLVVFEKTRGCFVDAALFIFYLSLGIVFTVIFIPIVVFFGILGLIFRL